MDDGAYTINSGLSPTSKMRIRRTLTPTSETLQELGLVEGKNIIRYVVQNENDEKQKVVTTSEAKIYLIDCERKIVISDVDGTITKSDVLGHLMPRLDQDWHHDGIVNLYRNIHDNGYFVVYLSSRGMGMSDVTKNYLWSVKQGDLGLPDGPLILSPDKLFHSFKREVI